MAEFPQTRISLILRLARPEDIPAWQEFAEIYAPTLYRMALAKGLQSADAEDLTQDILFAVARAAERFQPDEKRARFRTWLGRIARNLIADFYAGRAKRPVSQSLSDSWLQNLEEPSPPTGFLLADSCFEIEHRRAVFQVAAARVRRRVSSRNWQAFEQTALARRPVEEVAEEIDMRVGSIYVARSRIMKMLRSEVEELSGDEEATAASAGEVSEERRDVD